MAGDSAAPYVGPRPFERADRGRFFGRDNEAAALTSLIIAHQVVLLYAQSGAGKSSLLNAEVAPRLEARGFEVFGAMRVSGNLPAGVAAADVHNIYVFNALMSLAQWRAGTDAQRSTSISEYLRSVPHPPTTEGVAPIRILLFDQFEEIFTSFAERWKDRAEFFDDLGAALEEDPRLRVVLAMREEFIGGLDTYVGRLPERLRTRFRLERLGPEAALLAATKPLQSTDRTFKPEAARKLIDNLLKVPIKSATGVTDVSGEYVEPLHLQLVCTKLWDSLPPDVKLIDETYIENLGNVDEALADYYERCVKQVVAETGIGEGTLRAWFERTLITADGVRGLVPRGDEVTGGLPNDIVDRLQNLYLIRMEMRGVNPWYELTHDRFVAPIRRSNELWRDATGAGQLNVLELEARAEQWDRAGKPRNELLSGRELERITNLLASPELKKFGISAITQEFVEASERVAATRRRLVYLAVATVATLAVFGVVSAWLYLGKSQAEEEKLHAEDVTAIVHAGFARKFADLDGFEFDAITSGMRAVLPQMDKGRGPPPEATKSLGEALAKLGHVWLRGFNGQVTDVGIAPDGKYAVARSKDAICAWDTATGKLLFAGCLKLPKDSAPDYLFSPDRKWIYTRGRSGVDGTVQMWEAQTGKPAFEKQLADAQAIGISRDGEWAVAYGSRALRVIELANGEVSGALERALGNREIDSLAIAPKGNLIALITRKGDAELWNRKTGALIPTPGFKGKKDTYNTINFSADGRRVAFTSLDFNQGKARSVIWTIEGDRPASASAPILVDMPPGSPQFFSEFSRDANRVTTLAAGSAKVWDAVSGAMMASEYRIPENAYVQLLGDGNLLVGTTEGSQTTLEVIDPLKKGPLKRRSVPGEITNAGVSNEHARIVTLGKNNYLRVYAIDETPRELKDLSPKALFLLACEKIRPQQEFASVENEIKTMCNAIKP